MTAEEMAAKAARRELLIIDTQDPHAFAQAHVAGAYNLPFRRQGYDALARQSLRGWTGPVVVVAEHDAVAEAAASALTAAGLTVEGRYGRGVAGWRAAGLTVVEVADITPDALSGRLDEFQVLDVREPYEWRSGVVPNATLVPLSELEARLPELDKGRAYAVVCASGSRSAAASAWLAERGYNVANVVGGMALWLGAGHPTQPVASTVQD